MAAACEIELQTQGEGDLVPLTPNTEGGSYFILSGICFIPDLLRPTTNTHGRRHTTTPTTTTSTTQGQEKGGRNGQAGLLLSLLQLARR
jgi:hypothetical protein